MSSSTSPKKHNHNHKHKRTKSSLNIPTRTSTTPTTPIRNLDLNTDYLPQDYFTQGPVYGPPNPSFPQPIHISPAKAAASARLHHDLTTLTSWLEALFHPTSTPTAPPTPLPPHLLKWRTEVLSSTSASASGYSSLGTLAPSASALDPNPADTGASNLIRGDNGNAVLETLKTLKQANLSADHLRTLIHEAELEELSWLEDLQALSHRQREDGVQPRTILDDVYAGLDVNGRQALDSMSRSAVMLGLQFQPGGSAADGDGTDAEDLRSLFSRRVLEQAHRNLVVREQGRELELLQRVMNGRTEQDVKRGLGTTMDGSSMNDEEAEHIRAQTAQLNRDTKQINLKIMEYEDRVKSLERQLAGLRTSSTNMQEVLGARRRVEERKASVAALQQQVAVFHGLPPDLDASRNEIRRAMNELETMKRKRGGLFEMIGNG